MWLSCNKSAFAMRRPSNALSRKAFPIPVHPTAPSQDETARREAGTEFLPRFDAAGLITAVAIDAASGRLLMLAHMDSEALAKTRETGFAHFHSRSRGRLWMKGESSGHVLRVLEIRVDCDQDAIELRVDPAGPACHTLATSCFYRRLTETGALERIDD
jgi:phosphoribosyl-AMP cyclohydrolase